jgi:hypothetical protein
VLALPRVMSHTQMIIYCVPLLLSQALSTEGCVVIVQAIGLECKETTSFRRAESPIYVLQLGGEGWIGPTALTNFSGNETQAVGLGCYNAAPSVLVLAHGLVQSARALPFQNHSCASRADSHAHRGGTGVIPGTGGWEISGMLLQPT